MIGRDWSFRKVENGLKLKAYKGFRTSTFQWTSFGDNLDERLANSDPDASLDVNGSGGHFCVLALRGL